MNKFKIIFLLIILLTILVRIPFFPHEQGIDTFRTHEMANYIQNDDYAKWVISPFSLFGLFPYSYSIGIPYLLAILSDAVSINIELIILLLSILLGILGSIGVYILSFEIFNDDIISLISMLFFSLSPLFINFTLWTMSTRGPFVVLLIFIIYSFLKFKATQKINYLFTLLILTVIAALTHRLFMYILFVLIPIYLVSIYVYKNKEFFLKRKLKIIIPIFLILFVIQFINISPYKLFKIKYLSGFFLKGHSIYNIIDNLIIFLNLIIDYISSVGFISIFMIIGIFIILKNFNSKNINFNYLYLIIFLLCITPLLMIARYTPVFILSIFCIIGSFGFVTVIKILKNKIICKAMILFMIVGSIFFSIFMINNWLSFFSEGIYGDELPWISESSIKTIGFINEDFNTGILVSNTVLNQRLRAITDYSFLPADYKQDMGIFVFNYENSNKIEIDYSPYYLLTPTKSFIKLANPILDSEKDFEKLVSKRITDLKSVITLDYYNIKYVLEKKGTINSNRMIFYSDLELVQNRIYDNDVYYIYYIS